MDHQYADNYTELIYLLKNHGIIMKMFVAFLALLAVAAALPTRSVDPGVAARRALPALEHEEIHDEFGQYALRYVTAEGTVVSERGRLVPTPDGSGHVLVVEGEVSYVSDDGKIYVTKYSAGLDGTKVEGNHLPVAPQPVATEVPASQRSEVSVRR